MEARATRSRRQPYVPAAARKADILAATVSLLAEKGPTAVTLRRVAQRANVPHTLIVRHFGDKASLIGQATFEEMLRWADVVGKQDDPVRAFIAGFRHLCRNRVSGAALSLAVSGLAQPQMDQATFPVVDAHVEILVKAGLPRRAARDMTLAAVAMMAGFVAAEDWWVKVSQYRGGTARERVRRAMETQLEHLLNAGLAALEPSKGHTEGH